MQQRDLHHIAEPSERQRFGCLRWFSQLALLGPVALQDGFRATLIGCTVGQRAEPQSETT
jgi:hypothetical protein